MTTTDVTHFGRSAEQIKFEKTLLQNVLGPEPTGFFRRLDYKLNRFLVLKLQCRSPRFVLFRCLGCSKMISGRRPCKCGINRFSPTRANTWDAFWVWVKKR